MSTAPGALGLSCPVFREWWRMRPVDCLPRPLWTPSVPPPLPRLWHASRVDSIRAAVLRVTMFSAAPRWRWRRRWLFTGRSGAAELEVGSKLRRVDRNCSEGEWGGSPGGGAARWAGTLGRKRSQVRTLLCDYVSAQWKKIVMAIADQLLFRRLSQLRNLC